MDKDKEFETLKRKLQQKMLEVIVLQKQYRAQTGRDFVISKPLDRGIQDDITRRNHIDRGTESLP